ncbi:MAG: sugar phosphate isomerase/epimerase [Clostridiales bacterium]|nr:sugar phosphate isomerase/epimerase [Clostridiales bacterium]
MIFGMPTLIENGSLEQNIALCRRLGLDFIELNMNFPEYQLDVLKGLPLKRIAADNGIFFTLHLDERMDIADFNPLVSGAYRETARRAVDLALEAGMPVLNMHMNPGIYITLPDRKVRMYERNREDYLNSFRQFRQVCVQAAGGAGLKICAENTDGFLGFETEAIGILLEEPLFGLTWDIGHSAATGEKDMPWILAHADRLAHFHIHDGSAVPPKNHLALGDGQIPVAERLALARERGCRCVLETKTAAALEKSVRWLKEHGWR